MTTTTLIHFAKKTGNLIKCACGDWSHATNWTTVRTAVTCPECIKDIRENRAEPSVVVEGPWFGRQ